jgi:hypothetical protein
MRLPFGAGAKHTKHRQACRRRYDEAYADDERGLSLLRNRKAKIVPTPS